MWSKLFAAAVVALSSLTLPSTKPNEKPMDDGTVIYWSPKTKLIGENFKRKPIEESHFSAGSHLGTGMEIASADQRLKFTIQAYFVPDKSWIKVQDSDLLAHEQTHFDIEEYYARLIRMELGKMKTKGKNFDQIRIESDKIFSRLLSERERYQEKFDEETGHSVHMEKEKAWELDVKHKLQETQAYASPELFFVL